ncbi:UNVERIFIED_CONTAM: hypothetical protein HDU68_007028 [Siphonaria sp. JEL0065]|nr:hypothetical protein HDU68_007028 [Siphonaria sp. JEL0065]
MSAGSMQITAADAHNGIAVALQTLSPILQIAGPMVGPIFIAATAILEHCRAAKSNVSEMLALGDLVARTALSINRMHHPSPVHAEAVRKAMQEIQSYIERKDTSKIDSEHRVNRFTNKIKAIIGSKDTQVELSILQTRLVQAAAFLQLDLQIRTVTGIDDVKHDTEELLRNNEALTQKLDELTLKFDQLSDMAVFFKRVMERLDAEPGSDADGTLKKELAEIVARQQSNVLIAAERAKKRESSIPFNPSVEKWMISSLEVEFSPDDLIGKGSSSNVYKGYYHNASVAVKVFLDIFNDDPQALENAIGKELSTWTELNGKPYILKLIGACTKVAQPFIVSEYCKYNASKYVRNHPQQLYRILYEIACGLETVHAAGVIHRDIKGANILITETNHAAIADFGLSKNLLSRTSSTATRVLQSVGTLNWMSPEQRLSPSQITTKSDIWSFGMVMWELVAGQIPFTSKSDEEIVVAIQSEHGRPEMPQGCDPKLWALIQKCWALNPATRPIAKEIRLYLGKEFKDHLGSAITKVDWNIYMSYCWKNSREAYQKGSIHSLSACGPCDPRELARKLTSFGHVTWLDVDRLRPDELDFDHLTEAMKPSNLAVICVSNEYANSENCIHEFKFLRELKIPYVLVVVGPENRSGEEWRHSVIGVLSEDKLYIQARGTPTVTLSDNVFAMIVDTIEEELEFSRTVTAAATVPTLRRNTVRNMPVNEARKVVSRQQEAEMFMESAKNGNIAAQVTLARMYQKGDGGVTKDMKKAIDWFMTAGLAGDVSALYELARIYENGEGGNVDYVQALDWYKQAGNKNDSRAQFMVGEYYRLGLGVPKEDYPKAVEWYKKGASQKNSDCENALGLLYQYGLGVSKDNAKSVDNYMKSAEQGNLQGQINLGHMYKQGLGIAKDESRAADWYRKGAMLGDAESQYWLGIMHLNGTGVTRSYGAAAEWFQAAANQRFTKAINKLAYMYANGYGVAKDFEETRRLYSLASETGDAEGQNGLGLIYLNGLGVVQDFGKAFTLISKAAAQGYPEAQNNLAFMYRNGSGATRDLYKAYELYQKAAEMGNSDAQNSMGSKYLNGLAGASVSYSKAFEWFHKAALQNNPKGQFNVAFMYENGKHVHKDKNLAVSWYKKAAAQGFLEAEKALNNLGYK